MAISVRTNNNLLGNLTQKTEDGVSMTLGYSGQGQYTNNAGPHAVTAANGWSYVYDKTGNLTSATKTGQSTKTVQYSPFNTPTQITWGNKTSSLVYGPNQDRIKHSDSNGRVTTYIGGVYEEVTKGGVTYYIHQIGDIGQMVSTGAHTTATVNYEYTHRDQLGSIVAITGKTLSSAADIKRQSNGAWGERRYQQWNGPQDNALIPQTSARGFTDHEHMDAVGLIHMNGRVYDPELGRFLSADPIIQSPYNTQSYNRYSYVFNNPLSFTDPSGFTAAGYQSYGGSGYQDYGFNNSNSFDSGIDCSRTPHLCNFVNGSSCPPGAECMNGIDGWRYAQDLQNWFDRQQMNMPTGSFWGGTGYVLLGVVNEVVVQDIAQAVDKTGNGDYSGAVLSVAMAALKPLKAADKVNDSLNKTDALSTKHTIVSSGKAPKTSDPNSIYEVKRADGSKSITYYDEKGRAFSREDYGQQNPHKPHIGMGDDGRAIPHEHRFDYSDKGPIGEFVRILDVNGKPLSDWFTD